MIPEVKVGREIEVGALDLRDAILKTVFACALDETRPVLAGVYIKLVGKTVKMVATDSYRLAEKTINLEKKSDAEVNVIIPQRTMNELARILKENEEKVEVKIGDNQISFSFGDTQLISRLIEGNFPDYEQIIPQKSSLKITVNKDELTNIMKMASFFARESANNIKLMTSGKNQLKVAAVSPQVGDNISTIQAEIDGSEIEISFNAKFILDALGVIKEEKVTLHFNDKTSPGIIKPIKNNNYQYIIMPLRVE